jgi:hypothetical protein
MSDILIDNKKFYDFELKFLNYFNFVTKLTVILFLIGFFQNKPYILIQFNFVVKIILAFFLIYRFNSYRKHKIEFTELDKKRTDFEELIRDEVSGKATIIQLKE